MNVFTLYYLVATILMLVVVWNYQQNLFALLLILLAFSGTIAYWIPSGTQMMNIITVLLSTYLFVRNKVWQIFPHIRYLILSFIVFSLYTFFCSGTSHLRLMNCCNCSLSNSLFSLWKERNKRLYMLAKFVETNK